MLPDALLHWGVALFLGSLGIFVVIPALISYWRLVHGEKARQEHVHLEDVPGIIIALLLINVFSYLLGSEGAHPMPHAMLRLLLLALDIPFLLFLLDAVIVFLLVSRQPPIAPSDLPKESLSSSTKV